jgi:hypothetical protein
LNQYAVPWDGLVRVTENENEADPRSLYFDGTMYGLDQDKGDFSLTVESFTYPSIFEDHILAFNDARTMLNTEADDKPFSFSFRVNSARGYKIHIVYNISAVIDGTSYTTVGDSMTLTPFSFKLSTIPVSIAGVRESSHLILDTRYASPSAIVEVENLIYGTSKTKPTLPSVSELVALVNNLS